MNEFKKSKDRDRKGRPVFPETNNDLPGGNGEIHDHQKRVRSRERKPSTCAYCKEYLGRVAAEVRCIHMKIHHEQIVDEFIKKQKPESLKNLRRRDIDTFCWAAGILFRNGKK